MSGRSTLLLISSEASSRASSSTSSGTWPDSQRVRVVRAVTGAVGLAGSVASKRSNPLATNERPAEDVAGDGRRGRPTGSVASRRSDPVGDHERRARRVELGEQVSVLVAEQLALVHQPGDRDLLVTAPPEERDVGWHEGPPLEPPPSPGGPEGSP